MSSLSSLSEGDFDLTSSECVDGWVRQTLTLCRIKTAFAYIPHIKPDPPSALRQLAYREPSSLLGPQSDPEGWITLTRVHSQGLLLPNHPVSVQCTVSTGLLDYVQS
jgi:hypothetical protein